MTKFQKQNKKCYPCASSVSIGKDTVPLCKPTKSNMVVFDVALAVLPIWNNTFEINRYIALLPNSVGSTAKTYLPWHTILWKHYICSSLRVLWTKLSREAFKANKNSLSSLASSGAISSRDCFHRKSHCHTGNQSWLGSNYFNCFLSNQILD